MGSFVKSTCWIWRSNQQKIMQKSLAHPKFGELPTYLPGDFDSLWDHVRAFFVAFVWFFFSRPWQKTPSEKLPLVERMCRWWLIRTSIGKRTPKKCPRKSRAELVKSQWITRPLIAMYPSRELTSYSPIGMKLHLPKLPFEWGYLTLQTKKRTSMPLQKSMLRIFTWVLSGLKNGYFQGPKIAGSVSGQVPMDGYHGAPHRVTQGSVPPHPTLHVKSCNQRTFGSKRRDEAGPRGQKFQFFSAFC